MRRLRLRATEQFAQNLEDAAVYYLDQAGPQSASRFLAEYDDFCNLVTVLPGYGSLVGDSGLRWRKIGVFVAIYSIDTSEDEIVLLRLYYISQNWRTHALTLEDPE